MVGGISEFVALYCFQSISASAILLASVVLEEKRDDREEKKEDGEEKKTGSKEV